MFHISIIHKGYREGPTIFFYFFRSKGLTTDLDFLYNLLADADTASAQ
jgi:hypothetical protein